MTLSTTRNKRLYAFVCLCSSRVACRVWIFAAGGCYICYISFTKTTKSRGGREMRRDNAKVCSKLHSTPILPYHTTVHSPIPTHTTLHWWWITAFSHFLGLPNSLTKCENLHVKDSEPKYDAQNIHTYKSLVSVPISHYAFLSLHQILSTTCTNITFEYISECVLCAVCVRARLCMQIIRADRIRWGWRSLTAVSTNKNNKRLKKTADHWQHSTMQIAAKCLLKSQLVVTVLFHNIHINFYHITKFKHLAFGNDFRIHNDIILYDI